MLLAFIPFHVQFITETAKPKSEGNRITPDYPFTLRSASPAHPPHAIFNRSYITTTDKTIYIC